MLLCSGLQTIFEIILFTVSSQIYLDVMKTCEIIDISSYVFIFGQAFTLSLQNTSEN